MVLRHGRRKFRIVGGVAGVLVMGAKGVDGVASKFGVCREGKQEFRCEEVTRGGGLFLEFVE